MFDKFVPKLLNNNEFPINSIVENYSNIAWLGFYRYLSHWCHLCFLQLYKLERKGEKRVRTILEAKSIDLEFFSITDSLKINPT